MKICVDLGKCESHGMCMLSAPEVFNLVGLGELRYDANPDESSRDDVIEAADACPVQAITIIE